MEFSGCSCGVGDETKRQGIDLIESVGCPGLWRVECGWVWHSLSLAAESSEFGVRLAYVVEGKGTIYKSGTVTDSWCE